MALKSDKEKKGSKASAPEIPKETGKASSKAKKEPDEDLDEDDDDNFEAPKTPAKKNAKASSKSKKEEDDDDDVDDDGVEEVDDWEKVEETEEWDPDFDEFDVPKSKVKKSTGGAAKKTAKGGEEDELGLDEDFKDLDLFGEGGFEDEEDDF
jgi:DNA-directed RNA polymerase subunit delta